jgi:hypothetical protein
MPAQIVDKFNVDGQDYEIEPPMDAVPTEGSLRAVQSGGVYSELIATRGDTPTDIAPNTQGIFTRKGAYDFFGGFTKAKSWIAAVFGRMFGGFWERAQGEEFSPSDELIVNDIAHGNGLWVVVGGSPIGFAAWSEDGVHWTKSTWASGSSTATLLTVAYGNGTWVASKSAIARSSIQYSTDGKEWATSSFASSTSYYVRVWFVHDAFFAGLQDVNQGRGLRRSVDGITWSTAGSPGGDYARVNHVAYGNGYYICCTTGGIYRSTTGSSSWSARLPSAGIAIMYAEYANGVWVACCAVSGDTDNSGVWYSTDDGASWTHATSITSGTGIRRVHYAAGVWIAADGVTGTTWRSTNGQNWVQVGNIRVGGDNAAYNVVDINFANGLWILAQRNITWYSVDNGETWINLRSSGVTDRVAYNDGTWVIANSDLAHSNFETLLRIGAIEL